VTLEQAACDTTQYALGWQFQLIYVVAFVFIVVVATGGNAIVPGHSDLSLRPT